MPGIFLSYSRSDRMLAEQIIRGLRGIGVEVWWDEDMPGVNWQQELERQIKEMAAVVVVWTEHSSASNNVRDEARLGLNSDKLVNVITDVAQPPFPFDRVNALPLDGWTGRAPHHGWTRLVQTIEAMLVRAGGATPGALISALAARDGQIRLRQAAIEAATQAFQDAQVRDGEAGEAALSATAALNSAEQQHQWVVERRGSPALQHTAQQELEAARTANDEALAGQHAAKGELSEAARRLSHAKADLETLLADSSAPEEVIPASRPISTPEYQPPPSGSLKSKATPPPAPSPALRSEKEASDEIQTPVTSDTTPARSLPKTLADLFFGFAGRSSRAEFWLCLALYQVFYTLIRLAILTMDSAPDWLAWVLVPPLLIGIWPAFAVAAKRAHDTNHRAAWGFVLLTVALPFWFVGLREMWPLASFGFLPNPIVAELLYRVLKQFHRFKIPMLCALAATLINICTALALGLTPGTAGPNRFGPQPRRLFSRSPASA
jgi:uncharacterized membrane protein YhaH (DUF805 family)